MSTCYRCRCPNCLLQGRRQQQAVVASRLRACKQRLSAALVRAATADEQRRPSGAAPAAPSSGSGGTGVGSQGAMRKQPEAQVTGER